jgi:hypothetical protein
MRRQPVDASSGKQRRHRLNHVGDRQVNSALWRIVFTRMATDPRSQAYVARRTTEGKIAPRVDLEKDVLAHMGSSPLSAVSRS